MVNLLILEYNKAFLWIMNLNVFIELFLTTAQEEILYWASYSKAMDLTTLFFIGKPKKQRVFRERLLVKFPLVLSERFRNFGQPPGVLESIVSEVSSSSDS